MSRCGGRLQPLTDADPGPVEYLRVAPHDPAGVGQQQQRVELEGQLLGPQQARTASLARIHGLHYLTQANPADVDLEALAAGSRVLIRGLGLNFFDYVTLLTAGIFAKLNTRV